MNDVFDCSKMNKKEYEQQCNTIAIAAARGNFNLVKTLHTSGSAWNQEVCEFAAQNGHLEILKVYPTEHSTRAMLGKNKPDGAGTFSILLTLDFSWPFWAMKTKIFGQ